MANTISTTMMATAAPSATQLNDREVGDEIRYLGFGNAVLTSLIENSIFENSNRKTGKGLIGKRSVEQLRYEMFTRSPRPYKYTVSSGTEVTSSGIALDTVNGLSKYSTLFNPANGTQFRVESISTLTVKGTPCSGTTFSAAAGDVLILGATAFPEGSTESVVLNGSDDNNFNILQFSRFSVSISWVLEATKMLAGGNRFTREKMYLLWEALADMERSMLFSDYTASYASKNTTTGLETGYTGEFPTTKGIYQLAANSYNAQGNLDLSKIRKNLPLAMGDTVSDNQTQIALVSNEGYARIQEMLQDRHYNTEKEGILDKFGIKATNLVTSGPELKLVKHAAMNVTGMHNQMICLVPENLGYVHLKGHDLKPNNNIQTAATHGKQDELYAYWGIETKDAGKSITVVTNCF